MQGFTGLSSLMPLKSLLIPWLSPAWGPPPLLGYFTLFELCPRAWPEVRCSRPTFCYVLASLSRTLQGKLETPKPVRIFQRRKK